MAGAGALSLDSDQHFLLPLPQSAAGRTGRARRVAERFRRPRSRNRVTCRCPLLRAWNVRARSGDVDLPFLSKPCGIANGLEDVLAFEIRIVSENVLDRATGADLSNNHSDRDARVTDAGLAAHHSRLLRDAIQTCHVHQESLFNAQNISDTRFALFLQFPPGVTVR